MNDMTMDLRVPRFRPALGGVARQVICKYCDDQGEHQLATLLLERNGLPEKTMKPDTARYGCDNGHKFALPV